MPTIARRPHLIHHTLAWAILALLSLIGPLTAAAAPPVAPTVAELLATCARGYAQGNQGVDAAACEWFANPCGCRPGAAGRESQRWCIPAGESPGATVRKVVAQLRRQPDPAAPVDRVVPDILVRLYPCQPGAGG
jgi:hypothetical protein